MHVDVQFCRWKCRWVGAQERHGEREERTQNGDPDHNIRLQLRPNTTTVPHSCLGNRVPTPPTLIMQNTHTYRINRTRMFKAIRTIHPKSYKVMFWFVYKIQRWYDWYIIPLFTKLLSKSVNLYKILKKKLHGYVRVKKFTLELWHMHNGSH